MAASKILVSGGVDGKIGKLYKRVSSVIAKAGPFDALLVTGSFFSSDGASDDAWSDFSSGARRVPIPTYILGPSTEAQRRRYAAIGDHGGELCTDVIYLGPHGIMSLPSGLRVAYLSGCFDASRFGAPPPNVQTTEEVEAALASPGPACHCTAASVEALEASAASSASHGKVTDILLTGHFPSDALKYTRGAASQTLGDQRNGGLAAARAAMALRPRYHFCAASAKFYERAPYQNHARNAQPVACTRLLSIAPVANPAKEKWLYAFTIVPAKAMDPVSLAAQPEGHTPSPYDALTRNAPRGQTESFFFGTQRERTGATTSKRGRDGQQRPHPGKRTKYAIDPRPNTGCWFCMASPKFEKHLVVSVGDACYVAIAKVNMMTAVLLRG